MNTNIFDAMIMVAYFIFILTGFGGTAYLIQVHNWSPWWLLFTALVFTSIRFKTGH